MTQKELQDTVIVTGWKSVYIAKKTKGNFMSDVRREITESEILGLIDWYSEQVFEKDNCNEYDVRIDGKSSINNQKSRRRMTRCVSFTASSIDITPKSNNLIEVEMEVSESEFCSMIGYFDEKDVVEHFGERQLLEHMDVEEIIAYLSDIGVKSEWEELE